MSDEPNEIVTAAREAKAREDAVRDRADAKRDWPIGAIGVGVGIGSAAVAAAVLFAGRTRSRK